MKVFFILCALLTILVTGCGNAIVTDLPIDITEEIMQNGYPIDSSQSQIDTNLSYPISMPTLIPTYAEVPIPSSAEYGAITGTLFTNPSSPSPESGAIIYLTPVIYDAAGIPIIAGFSREGDLKSITDSGGKFIFSNVPVEKSKSYILVLDRVHNAFLLKDPSTGENLYISVIPGKINDLGELIYSDLPK